MLITLGALLLPVALAQAPDSNARMFLDCNAHGCDTDYLRTHLTFVNYVRFREDATVYVLVTGQENGSGGSTATAYFIGQGRWAGRRDTLTYSSSITDTFDEVRAGVLRMLKLGLVPFTAGTRAARHLEVVYRPPDSAAGGTAQAGRDRWNNWVFELATNAHFSGEAQTASRYVELSAEAARVTAAWKVSLEVEYESDWNRYRYAIDTTRDTTEFTTNSASRIFGGFVRSLGPHWGAGVLGAFSTSSYNNLQRQVWIAPAIEYDIFPYTEFTRRRIVFSYSAGVSWRRYADTTLYLEIEEMLPRHQLEIGMRFQQPWGSSGAFLQGSQYLHDLSKSHLFFSAHLSLRVVRGLDLNVNVNYSVIRDQLSLPRAGPTPQDVLLQRRQLATGYRYGLGLGLSYTFGSTFNNIVNSRFDNLEPIF